MSNYKIKHTPEEILAIYKITECKNKQTKLMSVLSYMKKHSNNNTLNYSITRLYSMYKRYHMTMSLSYFKKLVSELKPIFFTQEVSEKIADKEPVETIENTSIEASTEKPNNIIKNIYTNTINKSGFLNKKQKLELASDLMFKMGVRDITVETMVISKVKNSKVAIHVNGAINYIKTIINEKLTNTTLEYVVEQDQEAFLLNEMGAYLV